MEDMVRQTQPPEVTEIELANLPIGFDRIWQL